MKLITAIINKNDTSEVCDSLKEHGFYFTKLATTGGFLQDGNTTLMIGTDDEKVDAALDVIRTHSAKRMEMVPTVNFSEGSAIASSFPTEVLVGGATVFVTDVCRFEKF